MLGCSFAVQFTDQLRSAWCALVEKVALVAVVVAKNCAGILPTSTCW